MRKARLRSLADDRHDTFQILHHFIIGESKHRKSLRYKPGVAPSIECLARVEVVCLAIQFDHDPRPVTEEISDVVADRHLAPNAKIIDAVCLQITPEQRLGARHRPAK
jgi:hypothetical protein